MIERPLAIVPVKAFADAKSRLAPELSSDDRSRIGRALAARTTLCARDAGFDVLVVAATDEITAWAKRAGYQAVAQPANRPGLNGAVGHGLDVAADRDRRAVVIHADLPWVDAASLRPLVTPNGVVIVPSHDGGTTVLGGIGPDFPLRYGRGSFQAHLSAAPHATVVTSPRLALDLDDPHDLTLALRDPRGRWLARYLATSPR